MKYILITISVVAITLILALSGLVSGEGEVQYLRIHIRANSNSEIDQAVKYKVKDEVVEALIPVLADIESFDEATKVISQNFAMIEEVANGVLEENGFTYNNYKDLENKVKILIENKELRKKLGKNAYKYITERWTAKIATENLLKLFDSIINRREFEIKDGPASKEK